MSVLYLCDGKRCASCSEECKHTSQIEHAVNFKEDASGNYWEREKGMTKDEPKHDRDWIVGCIKHDGFIETDRGDKANHIILEALEADRPSRPKGVWIVDTKHTEEIYVHPVICSICGQETVSEDREYTRYCPNCGAKMNDDNA